MAFTDNFTSAWAMFSTRGSNNQLFTSTNTGGAATDTPIGGQYIGSAHKYRIQWDAGQVQYYVDGTLVHTDNATFGSNLNVAAVTSTPAGPASRSTGCTSAPIRARAPSPRASSTRARRRTGGR